MKAIIFTALIAVCSSANLDRSYLPPSSAKAAGGSSDILQPPNLPIGSYENDHQGVVVDAAVGIRASDQSGLSGLGASRISYGSTNSKVGEAAFRDKHLQGGISFLPQGFVDFNRPERIQASRDRISNIVRLENNLTPDSYNYLYQTDNGISAAEKAVVVDGVRAEGGYSYTGDDGQVYTVTYTADEDGFQPKGAHLPTPPPIPPEIMKSLEKNAKDEAAGLFDDGSYDAQKYNTAGDYSDSSDNDRYNDRQSNKVANRPGSNSPSSFFITQNNQAFKPNFSNQAGIFNNKEQANQIQFQTSEGTSNLATDTTPGLINKPDITQASFLTNNRFGETNPTQNLNQQTISTSQQFSQQTFGGTLNTSVNDGTPASSQDIVIPLSQQPLQNEDNTQAAFPSGKPFKIMNTIQGILPTQTSSLVSTINNNGNIIKPFTETKPSDALSSQATISPTNQPSRELTTPFETTVTSNVGTDHKPVNTFSSQVFAPVNFFTSPHAGKPQNNEQQSQLTNKFEDNIYNYNKPSLSPETVFQKPSFQGSDDKQDVNRIPVSQQNSLTQQPINGEIYQYNKPILSQGSSNIQGFGQTPSIESFSQNSNIKQQISAIQSTPSNQPGSTYESNIYEYNRPTSNSNQMQEMSTTSSIINVNQQQQNFEKQNQLPPSQSTNNIEKLDQHNKPSLQPFMLNHQTSQSSTSTKPSFGSSFPSMFQLNYSIQTPNSLKEQTTSENLNRTPPQSTFVQPQPTIPSFSQTIINQFRPQVPDATYDIPSKPFQQPNSFSDQSRITQSPQSFGNINKPTSQPILPSTTGKFLSSFQNNGITQASISSFVPNTASLFNQPTNSPFNSRPSSTFAQAAASTGPFPTLPSLKPQEPTPISQFQPSNTYDGAIYQYNKPEESFPAKPEKSEEKIIETPPINGQLNPQFMFSLDNKGSVIEKFEFKPVSSPQVIPTLSNTLQGPTFDQFKPDQSKLEASKEADSRPIGSTILGSACCSGHLQQNKQLGKPETNRNELNAQSLTLQEASSTIKGEQFDVNRIPSTFDSTGYHY
ncbi:formin-J-like isoform X1 [Pieris napi]|uniref:formin-J-like isoform X1 n=1 Tax=Pieris napi TaxID=78633 RepID=UPI001FBA5598|nr:formin-J-like isoform X1 [Pieris napi]